MRTVIAAAAAIAAVLTLTACGSSEEKKPDAKPSPKVDKEESYILAVRARAFDSWTEKGPTDTRLALYPPKWCTALEEGHSVEWIFSMTEGGLYPIGMDWGTKEAEANELLVLGVKYYCPKYSKQVTEELRDSGAY